MQTQPSVRAAGMAAGLAGEQPRPVPRQAPGAVRVRRTRVAVLLLAVALLLMVPGLARGDGPDRPAPRVTYTVQAGDTLWAIARRSAPSRDPREIVDQLIRDNHLRGQLQPGQRLSLPAPAR